MKGSARGGNHGRKGEPMYYGSTFQSSTRAAKRLIRVGLAASVDAALSPDPLARDGASWLRDLAFRKAREAQDAAREAVRPRSEVLR